MFHRLRKEVGQLATGLLLMVLAPRDLLPLITGGPETEKEVVGFQLLLQLTFFEFILAQPVLLEVLL